MLKSMEIQWLNRLCKIPWNTGKTPLDWQTGVIIPLFKKGDQKECSNYRKIFLLSLPGKVYAKVLEQRCRVIVDSKIQEEQCGFRAGCSTTDQIFALKLLIDKSWEFAKDVHMCFVDFEKAYDRVNRKVLWKFCKNMELMVNFCGLLLSSIQIAKVVLE
jgi:reverse transcriptase-like protein